MWKARPREGQGLAVATGMWVAFCAPSGACLLGTFSGFDVSPATATLLQPVQGSLWLGLTGLGAGPGELSAPHLRTPGSCWRLRGRSEGGPAPERPMVTPKPVLWALLLALLGTALPAQPRACSVPDVLRHYQAVIFEDLQAAARRAGPGDAGAGPGSRHLHFVQKNQTDAVAPGRRGRVGPSCGAQKVRGPAHALQPPSWHFPSGSAPSPAISSLSSQEHSILVSIAALGRALRGAVAGDPRGALERAAWTVALRTEAVMRRHCRPLRQVRRGWWARPRPQRHRGRRRRLLLRALDAVATCWEKLFALRALGSRGP
ncbi:uncharacterized protein C20orf204 homolog isoform X2 [Myotis daubentonii]|uniref:uncharacterized protein C20orf204 homolog isoform X2 n=1 Tax=Myotis daubentonii TaxID=98922 RepID=UPI0028737919|nr:uncharacterized protein C20orf204 homolog isoform X2 [Myotis daubentonii]